MHKTIRRGFSLIELMVVMAIIAVLAVIGIGALMGINTSNILDRATEEIITSIRESQNKAISVSSNPDGSDSIPLAWGIQIDQDNKNIELFVLTDLSEPTVTKTVYDNVDIEVLDSISVSNPGDSTYFFTTPFGKYYSTGSYNTLTWADNKQRPYDLLPSSTTATKTKLTITYRGKTREITIEANGDVYAQ